MPHRSPSPRPIPLRALCYHAADDKQRHEKQAVAADGSARFQDDPPAGIGARSSQLRSMVRSVRGKLVKNQSFPKSRDETSEAYSAFHTPHSTLIRFVAEKFAKTPMFPRSPVTGLRKLIPIPHSAL